MGKARKALSAAKRYSGVGDIAEGAGKMRRSGAAKRIGLAPGLREEGARQFARGAGKAALTSAGVGGAVYGAKRIHERRKESSALSPVVMAAFVDELQSIKEAGLGMVPAKNFVRRLSQVEAEGGKAVQQAVRKTPVTPNLRQTLGQGPVPAPAFGSVAPAR